MSTVWTTDAKIRELLEQGKSWREIKADLKVGLNRISRVASIIGSAPGSAPGHNQGPEIQKLRTALAFLNDFFKQKSDLLLADEATLNWIIDHKDKFDEVEKLCQV